MRKYSIVYRYNVYLYNIEGMIYIYMYIFMSRKNVCILNMHLYNIIDVDIQIRL